MANPKPVIIEGKPENVIQREGGEAKMKSSLSEHIGKRYVYTVERNPHSHGARPGTYEGEVIKVEDFHGVVKTEAGTFRGIIFTLACDDGREVTTSAFADLSRPVCAAVGAERGLDESNGKEAQ